jgi:hypothetical protein
MSRAGERIFTMPDEQTSNDIDYILQQATQCRTLLDELAMLRVAFRAYANGMSAADAVAWAAKEISESITRAPRRKRS